MVYNQAQDAPDSGRSDHHGEDAVVFRDERGAEEGEAHESGDEANRRGEGPRDPGDLRLHAGEEQASQDAALRGFGLLEWIEDRGHLLDAAEDRSLRAASRAVVAVLPAVTILIRVRRTSDRRPGDGDHPGAGLPGPEAGDMRETLLLQRH